MVKSELITQISIKANISKMDAERVLEAVINSIVTAAKEGKKVRLNGFGSFFMSLRPEREKQIPKTGEKIKIPASNKARFIAGKGFKDALNGKKATPL